MKLEQTTKTEPTARGGICPRRLLRMMTIVVIVSCMAAVQFGVDHFGNKASATDNFSFEDYLKKEELVADLRILLPEGTPRSRVDEVLVQQGGASVRQIDDSNEYSYMGARVHSVGSPNDNWPVVVMFYADETVRQIKVEGSPVHPVAPPIKVSDATVFRFEDYNDVSQLMNTLRLLLPLYTPRERVETVLVKWAGASIFAGTEDNTQFLYSKIDKKRVWNVRADYLSDGTLFQIGLDGSLVHEAFAHTRQDALRVHRLSNDRSQPPEED